MNGHCDEASCDWIKGNKKQPRIGFVVVKSVMTSDPAVQHTAIFYRAICTGSYIRNTWYLQIILDGCKYPGVVLSMAPIPLRIGCAPCSARAARTTQ